MGYALPFSILGRCHVSTLHKNVWAASGYDLSKMWDELAANMRQNAFDVVIHIAMSCCVIAT